jgi:hypothetical protein
LKNQADRLSHRRPRKKLLEQRPLLLSFCSKLAYFGSKCLAQSLRDLVDAVPWTKMETIIKARLAFGDKNSGPNCQKVRDQTFQDYCAAVTREGR